MLNVLEIVGKEPALKNNMINKINVLAIDDEEVNLDIMKEYFESDPKIKAYLTSNGFEALRILEQGLNIDVIVLDRMMPVMNGMEFLKKIKENKMYQNIPVIMQTAASTTEQIKEGIEAGVFYYLSKPYSDKVLLSLINAANDDYKRKKELVEQLSEYGRAMLMIQKGEFLFQTMDEAKALSILVGTCLPNSDSYVIGITELMINAVEHGNLAITYEEKANFKINNIWENEVERRLELPGNKNKYCRLRVDRRKDEVIINIKDQGPGFNWKQFTEFDPKRMTDPNGRGIMFSMNCGMQVNYLNAGNEVECRIDMSK